MDLSIKEAATLIGKSERTVRHMAQTGRLPARRIGSRWVIRRADLDGLGKGGKTRKSAAKTPPTTPQNHSQNTVPSAPKPPPIPAAEALPVDSKRPDNRPQPSFTVSFSPASPPAEPGDRNYPDSIRELDAFAIGTAILSGVAEGRRNPRSDDALLAETEQALRAYLQFLADGCHQADPRRKQELFQEAQSRACSALSGLVHYNLVYTDPDFSRLAERIETHLLTALQELRVTTQKRLTWRGRAVTAAEVAIEKLLQGARSLAGNRLGEHIETFERSIHRALQHAL
ncbi:MAG TPA: DNA-binding protein [Nannocystis exedens]|nr:DNA-binding protein [Nannocystis exedens]